MKNVQQNIVYDFLASRKTKCEFKSVVTNLYFFNFNYSHKMINFGSNLGKPAAVRLKIY